MDAQPHTHDIKLQRLHDYIDEGPWIIRYGDTKVRVCFGFRTPTKALVERAVRKAIQKHDAGSIKAGRKEAQKAEAKAYIRSLVSSDIWETRSVYNPQTLGYERTPAHWGSDVLKEKVGSK